MSREMTVVGVDDRAVNQTNGHTGLSATRTRLPAPSAASAHLLFASLHQLRRVTTPTMRLSSGSEAPPPPPSRKMSGVPTRTYSAACTNRRRT